MSFRLQLKVTSYMMYATGLAFVAKVRGYTKVSVSRSVELTFSLFRSMF